MTELILALDVQDRSTALHICRLCAPYLDAVKIGYPLVLPAGLSIARELQDMGLPLIADFKVADIPNTSRIIAEQVFDAGFSAIICHGFVGSDAVSACVEAAHDAGGECLVVAEMSHPGAVEFFRPDVAADIARLALESGADGIIAPATRPERVTALRKIAGRLKIYSPGVGAQGGDPAAIAAIVDGIIVGRQIYGAEDPAAEAGRLAVFRR